MMANLDYSSFYSEQQNNETSNNGASKIVGDVPLDNFDNTSCQQPDTNSLIFSEIKTPANLLEQGESKITPLLPNEGIIVKSSEGSLLGSSDPASQLLDSDNADKLEQKSKVNLLTLDSQIFQIETEKIKPNPYQPRREFSQQAIEELATSINEYGILEPLIVQRIEKETPNGIDVEYQLIAGERRLRAAQFLGMKTVPVIIKDINSESLNLEIALVENIQREDLNPIAKAKSYMQLINKFGYTQEMVGKKVGKSRESIANTLRLLQLPFEAQKALEEGKITESHARAILLLPNMEKQRALLGEIISKQLSSREAEQISRQYLANYVPHKNENVRQRLGDSFNPQDLELREKLESVFDTKVSIKRKGDKGEIAIYFNSDDELENIVNKISKFSQKIIDQTAANL